MSTTTNTPRPLYEVLNEERTQGECTVNTMPLPSRKVVELKTGGALVANFMQMNHKKAKLYKDTETEANAQYTALAVNNLHLLAEALEEIKKAVLLLEQTEDFTEAQQRALYNEMFHTCREALQRIS